MSLFCAFLHFVSSERLKDLQVHGDASIWFKENLYFRSTPESVGVENELSETNEGTLFVIVMLKSEQFLICREIHTTTGNQFDSELVGYCYTVEIIRPIRPDVRRTSGECNLTFDSEVRKTTTGVSQRSLSHERECKSEFDIWFTFLINEGCD